MSSQCNDRQSCCLCCQIGKRAFEDHGTCDPNIMLPEPCKSSYLACCEERIMNQVNPIIPIPSKPTTPPPTTKRTTTTTVTTTPVYIPTTRKRSVCEQFGNTLCDHICVDNPEKFGKTFWCECRDGFERVDEKCVPIKTRVCEKNRNFTWVFFRRSRVICLIVVNFQMAIHFATLRQTGTPNVNVYLVTRKLMIIVALTLTNATIPILIGAIHMTHKNLKWKNFKKIEKNLKNYWIRNI